MELLLQVQKYLDRIQFAYRTDSGVDDATIALLNLLYKHLEDLVDFSSFNTIKPQICYVTQII